MLHSDKHYWAVRSNRNKKGPRQLTGITSGFRHWLPKLNSMRGPHWMYGKRTYEKQWRYRTDYYGNKT